MISVQVEFDVNDSVDINEEWLQTACSGVLVNQGYPQASVTLIISDDECLSRLKKEFFSKDQLTDIIAFNLEDENEPIEGEIYISLERIRKNAREFNQEFDTELKRVIIHGCLHLTGLDDQTEDDKNNMTRLEDSYLAKYSEPVLA